MGDGKLAWQVRDEAWSCDGAACTQMTPSIANMITCRKRTSKLRIAYTALLAQLKDKVIHVLHFGAETTRWFVNVPNHRYPLFSLLTIMNTFSMATLGGCPQSEVRALNRLSNEWNLVQLARF